MNAELFAAFGAGHVSVAALLAESEKFRAIRTGAKTMCFAVLPSEFDMLFKLVRLALGAVVNLAVIYFAVVTDLIIRRAFPAKSCNKREKAVILVSALVKVSGEKSENCKQKQQKSDKSQNQSDNSRCGQSRHTRKHISVTPTSVKHIADTVKKQISHKQEKVKFIHSVSSLHKAAELFN